MGKMQRRRLMQHEDIYEKRLILCTELYEGDIPEYSGKPFALMLSYRKTSRDSRGRAENYWLGGDNTSAPKFVSLWLYTNYPDYRAKISEALERLEEAADEALGKDSKHPSRAVA